MLEFLFVLYLIFLFIFPMAALAVALGLVTTHGLYNLYELISNQPEAGRGLLRLHALLSAVNTLSAAGLAVLLALAVHLLIYRSPLLFLFNVAFSFAIAVRWFDFTHVAYRRLAEGQRKRPAPRGSEAAFVVCRGYSPGGLLGWRPAFLDAGLLLTEENEMVFDGVFTRRSLSADSIRDARKKSFERLRVTLRPGASGRGEEALTLILKDNFYPFRSRDMRNHLHERLKGILDRAPAPQPV